MILDDEKVFEILLPMAEDILNTRYRHVACVVLRNKIISYGISQKKSHPFAAKYGGRNGKSIYWHAETMAIHNAIDKIGEEALQNCTLYVMRLKYADTFKHHYHMGESKPCAGCQRCIEEHGINRVVYSIGENHFGTYFRKE